MKVKDAMHKGVDWVGPDTPVTELAKLMRDHDVGGLAPALPKPQTANAQQCNRRKDLMRNRPRARPPETANS